MASGEYPEFFGIHRLSAASKFAIHSLVSLILQYCSARGDSHGLANM